MLFETLNLIFNSVTFGIMSTLVAQIILLLIIKHDKAGYHWRLWGFAKGRYGGKLTPTVCFGVITVVSLLITAVSIPIIVSYFRDMVYIWLDSLAAKKVVLLPAEFLFTCFFLTHFVQKKVKWDKWKIGFLVSSTVLFVLFALLLIFT